MGKFLTTIVIILLLGLTYVGYTWINKVEEGKSEGPRIEDLRVCEFVSYNSACAQDTTKISQDNGDIYATIQPKDITNSVLKVKWEFIQGGSKSVIAEADKDVFNDEVIQLKLEKDLTTGWLLGKYLLTVTLEGANELTKEFSIVSD
ncbi:hypothetical protein HYV12_03380 [Candidatus Dojkabacteria bacterium]|nr:hypothetical protein [Candidatus Dojkabacteria bacterium]